MTTLNQTQDQETYFMGWYGACTEDCSPLDLTMSFVRDKIYKVYQIRSNSGGYLVFDASFPAAYDTSLQNFTTLDCGHAYIIVLKPGTGSLDLPQFIGTTIASADAGRVVDDCEFNVTPTPTTTPAPPPTPTPTPTTPQPSPTPTPTRSEDPGVPPSSACDGYPYSFIMKGSEVVDQQISFTMFKENTRICHWGATGGMPTMNLVRIAGTVVPVGKIIINGMINNKSIKYITPTGEVYRGTFTFTGTWIDVVLTDG